MIARRADEGATIIGLPYDPCAAIYEHVNRFPRAQRTLLGRLILDEALRMLAALALANRLQDKREALVEPSVRLDALRIALRLASGWRICPTVSTARGDHRRGREDAGWLAECLSGREARLRRAGLV